MNAAMPSMTGTAAGLEPSSQSGTTSPRLHQAAVQFESMLLKDLLKPLAQSDGMSDTGSGGSGGEQTGTLQNFAVDAIAGTMAKSGALGFAKQIEASLLRGAAKHFLQAALKS